MKDPQDSASLTQADSMSHPKNMMEVSTRWADEMEDEELTKAVTETGVSEPAPTTPKPQDDRNSESVLPIISDFLYDIPESSEHFYQEVINEPQETTSEADILQEMQLRRRYAAFVARREAFEAEGAAQGRYNNWKKPTVDMIFFYEAYGWNEVSIEMRLFPHESEYHQNKNNHRTRGLQLNDKQIPIQPEWSMKEVGTAYRTPSPSHVKILGGKRKKHEISSFPELEAPREEVLVFRDEKACVQLEKMMQDPHHLAKQVSRQLPAIEITTKSLVSKNSVKPAQGPKTPWAKNVIAEMKEEAPISWPEPAKLTWTQRQQLDQAKLARNQTLSEVHARRQLPQGTAVHEPESSQPASSLRRQRRQKGGTSNANLDTFDAENYFLPRSMRSDYQDRLLR